MANILIERTETFGAAQSSRPCAPAAFIIDRICPVDQLVSVGTHVPGSETRVTPRSAVFEDSTSLKVELEMPGVEPTGVEIVDEGNVIRARGRRSGPQETKLVYEARVVVPQTFNVSAATAEFKQGVLTLVIPKLKDAGRSFTPKTS